MVEFTELLFGDSVENILKGLLVLVVDELVNESALAFVTPQADHEETWVLYVLEAEAGVDDLLVTLGDAGHTTEDSSELTDSENVMELGGRGEQLGGSGFPKLDGSLDERANHAENLSAVLLLR